MDDDLLYDEFGTGLARFGALLAVTSLGYALFEGLRGFPNDALGLIVGIIGPIAGLTLWSVSRYSRIRLTRDALHIGRDTLRPGDLDPAFGVKGAEALTDRERAQIESPVPIPKSATVRIPGGAFGRIMGTNTVVLRGADRATKLAFFTRRPDELAPILEKWLSAQA